MSDTVLLKNKRIAVVGLGLTGLSCVRFLIKQGADVIALDTREHLNVECPVPVFLGKIEPQYLLDADMVLLSPGVDPKTPAVSKAIDAGVEVIGDIELFARFNHRPVVAITGSNGKSTVTSLVAAMLKEQGINAKMGGNIGTPVLELLEQEADVFVLELSSFQLETVSSLQPIAATILNLCDDHLDRHGTMQAYQKAKQRIYFHAGTAIYNRDDAWTKPETDIASVTFGQGNSEAGFGWDAQRNQITDGGEAFLSADECSLSGTHNLLNIQAAAGCARVAGASDEAIKKAARMFSGLPHRFETVGFENHVRWINDSKATNVGATIAAIVGLAPSVKGKVILIAGGDGKGADFVPLKAVFEAHVAVVITLGKDGDQIAALSQNAIRVTDLKEAVESAAKIAGQGDVVLLSPACASLDMFKNYQQRGDCFAKAVKELAA